jgi:hypothetical protein
MFIRNGKNGDGDKEKKKNRKDAKKKGGSVSCKPGKVCEPNPKVKEEDVKGTGTKNKGQKFFVVTKDVDVTRPSSDDVRFLGGGSRNPQSVYSSKAESLRPNRKSARVYKRVVKSELKKETRKASDVSPATGSATVTIQKKRIYGAGSGKESKLGRVKTTKYKARGERKR